MKKTDSKKREPWEEELLAMHRWGRLSFWFRIDDEQGKEEHKRLKKLWIKARPLDKSSKAIMKQIISLEICNWKLEQSILALCAAIGAKKPAEPTIGHLTSMSEERWQKLWAYYLNLREWLSHGKLQGHRTYLKTCDPKGKIKNHIFKMLGKHNMLKETYTERFCLCLERWLGGYPPQNSPQMAAHNAAVQALDRAIKVLDPKSKVLHKDVLKADGEGRLIPCNHKAFRRYDLIISSIGAEKWRAVMARRGTDGQKRANTLKKYLSPIESWVDGKTAKTKLSKKINRFLGRHDDTKIFLASLLVSLLRPQQIAARMLAERRERK